MTPAATDPNRRLRQGIYAILIALAAGDMTGRLLAVNSTSRAELEQHIINQRVAQLSKQLRSQGLDSDAVAAKLSAVRPQIELEERRQTPFLGSNDRSRWLAIRALVDEGTFAIDHLVDRHLWNSIDMVQHRGLDAKLHLYSSKPPLLTVILAGEYWLIKAVTGWNLADNPYEVGRTMLWFVNVLPMIWLLALVARWAERFGETDWGRIFVVAAASFGTLLLPFAVVLNNHLIAAVAAAVAIDAALRIWFDGDRRIWWFAVAGFASAFAAADDLPALSLLATIGAGLALVDLRGVVRGFVPAAAAVVIAFFGTNYAAHFSLRPPYAHRSAVDPDDNWYDYTYTVGGQTRRSYWHDPQGVDRGEPSRGVYALHMLVGHHGVFSLTPVWLLSIWGLAIWLRAPDRRLQQLAAAIALVSGVCILFFIARPQLDRNYGGMTSGFRWLLWLAPAWLAAMIPAADRASRSRTAQIFSLVLLTLSVLSASYPVWNPWTHPWIYRWLSWSGIAL